MSKILDLCADSRVLAREMRDKFGQIIERGYIVIPGEIPDAYLKTVQELFQSTLKIMNGEEVANLTTKDAASWILVYDFVRQTNPMRYVNEEVFRKEIRDLSSFLDGLSSTAVISEEQRGKFNTMKSFFESLYQRGGEEAEEIVKRVVGRGRYSYEVE